MWLMNLRPKWMLIILEKDKVYFLFQFFVLMLLKTYDFCFISTVCEDKYVIGNHELSFDSALILLLILNGKLVRVVQVSVYISCVGFM